MQVMPVQPLLLHSHPLQLCRLSVHGLELVSSRHLRNSSLKLSWISCTYLKCKNGQNEESGVRDVEVARQGKVLKSCIHEPNSGWRSIS